MKFPGSWTKLRAVVAFPAKSDFWLPNKFHHPNRCVQSLLVSLKRIVFSVIKDPKNIQTLDRYTSAILWFRIWWKNLLNEMINIKRKCIKQTGSFNGVAYFITLLLLNKGYSKPNMWNSPLVNTITVSHGQCEFTVPELRAPVSKRVKSCCRRSHRATSRLESDQSITVQLQGKITANTFHSLAWLFKKCCF